MNVKKPYDSLSLNECVDLIDRVGKQVTILVTGPIGCGKSSMLKILAAKYPDHVPVYCDITTKDSGDFLIPQIRTLDGTPVCSFIANEELGFHLNKPIVLLLDELGKAPKAVMNACLRLMLERKLGTYTLPEGSIVFATTNLANEGVGDSIPAHARNRIGTVKMRKPTASEWRYDFAQNHGIDPVIIASAIEYPAFFGSPEDYERPDMNDYIHDVRSPRAAFVTPRSLEKASDVLKACRDMDENVLIHALMGIVGERATLDIMNILRLDNTLPTVGAIMADPLGAVIPTSGAGLCIIVSKAIGSITKETFDPWMDYLQRLPREATALFARGIMSSNCPKRPLATTNKKFSLYCVNNGHLF
ncbi:MAG: ATP-binding protein [Methylococcaceae bacterium]|nr:ATP-binding protein [Methylococcaceae bacterium]